MNAAAVCEFNAVRNCGPATIKRIGRSGDTGKRKVFNLCAQCAAAIDAIPEWRN